MYPSGNNFQAFKKTNLSPKEKIVWRKIPQDLLPLGKLFWENHRFFSSRTDHKNLWEVKRVYSLKGGAAFEKQKKNLPPLTKQQLEMIRGLLLSGRGQLLAQKSEVPRIYESVDFFSELPSQVLSDFSKDLDAPNKKGKVFSFFLEESLEKADLIYFCWRNLSTENNRSWVNMPPKVNRKRRAPKKAKSSLGPLWGTAENLASLEKIEKTLDPLGKPELLVQEDESGPGTKKKNTKNYAHSFREETQAEERLYFNSFTTKQLSSIQDDFYAPLNEENLGFNPQNKKTNPRRLPPKLQEKLTKESLAYWQLGSGQSRLGFFFLNLKMQTMEERLEIQRALNAAFPFQCSLLSERKDSPFQKALEVSLGMVPFGLSPRQGFEDSKKALAKKNQKIPSQSQLVIWKNGFEFQQLIQGPLFDLHFQELLFRKKQQSAPFEQRHRLTQDFADDLKDSMKNPKIEIPLEWISKDEITQQWWSKEDLIASSFRKKLLIKNYLQSPTFFPEMTTKYHFNQVLNEALDFYDYF